MGARREVILSVFCALLVACAAVESAPLDSNDSTIEGVGVLPSGSPVSDPVVVAATDQVTTTVTVPAPTTTLVPAVQIGSLVTGNRLLMIGDSITASAAQRYGGELCDALVPLGWQVEVDAEPSRFIDFGNTVLDQRLSAKWDAAYVFLGTNYLGDQNSYFKQLEKIIKRLSPRPVVLLTVTEFAESRRQVNDAITLVSSQYANVHVLDWGAIAAADAATVLRGDGHHLTASGRATLASVVAGYMGQAPAETGRCLKTSFTDDAGLSVDGSDVPPEQPVGATQTTVKQQPASTVGGGATGTTKPPTTVSVPATTTTPTTPATQASTTTPQPTLPAETRHRPNPSETTAP
jgi:hypothetical protein